jgi:hypothetical protein
VPTGKALGRARELAELYLKAPEVTLRNTRIHFIQPLKERIVREVGYGLSLEGASSADLAKSIPVRGRASLAKVRSHEEHPARKPLGRVIPVRHGFQPNKGLIVFRLVASEVIPAFR